MSNANDRCAARGCYKSRAEHPYMAGADDRWHYFVEPAPQPAPRPGVGEYLAAAKAAADRDATPPEPTCAKPRARMCSGCGKGFPITCVAGSELSGYWHLDCLRAARKGLEDLPKPPAPTVPSPLDPCAESHVGRACPFGHVPTVPASDGEADVIAEGWLTRGPDRVPMGGMVGRVFGAAREAYAVGFAERAALVRERDEWRAKAVERLTNTAEWRAKCAALEAENEGLRALRTDAEILLSEEALRVRLERARELLANEGDYTETQWRALKDVFLAEEP